MGKAEGKRGQSARERIAAQQAGAGRGDRRRQLLLAGGSVVAVLAIVVAFVVIKTLGGPASAGSGQATASASLAREVTSVPAATLTPGGRGTPGPKPTIPVTGHPPPETG